MPHKPVLLKEAVEFLNPESGDIIVDATLGSGGHSLHLCQNYPDIQIIGIDRDKDALRRSSALLEGCKTKFAEDNFRNLDKVLDGLGLEKVQGFIFDLGLNSEQLENSGRGFSFQENEPLLMTFKEEPGDSDFTADEILNNWNEETLANIIFGYGEEPYARRIARAIVSARPIKTTFELVSAIKGAIPKKALGGRRHFATKTFQALRIAVNDELEALKEALEKAFLRLDKNGRLVVISFHSLEDKIVKEFFKEKGDLAQILTKKLIVPERKEVLENPRSRSAKMRVLEKI